MDMVAATPATAANAEIANSEAIIRFMKCALLPDYATNLEKRTSALRLNYRRIRTSNPDFGAG